MSLSAVALASGAFWSIVAFRIWRDLPFTRPVADGLRESPPDPAPLVSVIVPAHNEQGKAGQCIASILANDWPALEVIAVLDRCTDGTIDELRPIAARDPRFTIIENTSCPSDWAGKCNAARVGTQQAKGTLLLFTDADTRFDPRLVRASVGLLHSKQLGLLSLLSTLTRSHDFERRVQPVAALELMKRYPLGRANRLVRPRPFANGQFMLFDREVYERIGGHAAVREALLEDLAFAWAVVRGGSRSGVFVADGMLVTSMYDHWAQFREGWKRIYIEAYARSVDNLRRAALGLIAVSVVGPLASVACALWGIVAIAQQWPGAPWTFAAGAITLTIALGVLTWIHARMRAPKLAVLHHAPSAWKVAAILREGARDLEACTPVRWGGRAYVLESRERRRERMAREAARPQ